MLSCFNLQQGINTQKECTYRAKSPSRSKNRSLKHHNPLCSMLPPQCLIVGHWWIQQTCYWLVKIPSTQLRKGARWDPTPMCKMDGSSSALWLLGGNLKRHFPFMTCFLWQLPRKYPHPFPRIPKQVKIPMSSASLPRSIVQYSSLLRASSSLLVQ